LKDGEDLLPLSCYERGVIEMLRKIPQQNSLTPQEVNESYRKTFTDAAGVMTNPTKKVN
jgi:hypothetical protein